MRFRRGRDSARLARNRRWYSANKLLIAGPLNFGLRRGVIFPWIMLRLLDRSARIVPHLFK